MSVYALYALRRRYGQALALGDADALSHLGPVIQMFSPDEDLAAIQPIRPYVRRSGKSGPVWLRAALDVLRTANGPLTASELARRVVAVRGLPATPRTLASARTAIQSRLANKPGVICHLGTPRRWSLS